MLDNEEEKKEVLSRLLEDIARNEYHLTTGNQCSKYVVEVLFQNGYIDEAYRLLVQKTYPSWGYMIENDATTLWERWEKWIPIMENRIWLLSIMPCQELWHPASTDI